MKMTGEKLRQAREAQNLSISEVSLVTKISPRVLQAIEEGSLERLPAKSFLRGFVLTYSQHLKLNSDEILALFFEELKALEPPPELTISTEEKNSDSNSDSAPQSISSELIVGSTSILSHPHAWKWIGFGSLALLIALTLGIKKVVDKYQKEKQVEPLHLSETSTVVNDDDSSTVIQPPKAAQKTAQKPEPVSPTQSPDSASDSSLSSQKDQEASLPEVRAAQSPNPSTSSSETSPQNEEEAAPPPPPRRIAQEIILEALDRIEVNMQMGARNIKLILQPDEVYTFKSSEEVSLEFSDGGAVNIIVNGRDKGVPGDLGVPKKITLP